MSEIPVPNEDAEIGEEIPPRVLELFVGGGEKSQAVTPVRWCVNRRFLTLFAEELFPRLFIVISVSRAKQNPWDSSLPPRFSETARYIFPLSQMLGYVTFQGPGRHRLQGMIVWKKDPSSLYSLLDRYSDSSFKGSLLNFQGDWDPHWRMATSVEELRQLKEYGGLGHDLVEVDVSPEFFAKEPPAWLARIVNFPYEDRPRDQCQFRRRLLAAPFMLFLTAAYWLALMSITNLIRLPVVLWTLVAGLRGFRWRELFHFPLEDSSGWSVFVSRLFAERYQCHPLSLRRSIFFYSRDGVPRSPFCRSAAPLFWLPLAGATLLYLAGTTPETLANNWWLFLSGAPLASVLIGALITLVRKPFASFAAQIKRVVDGRTEVSKRIRIREEQERRRQSRQREREDALRAKRLDEYQPLVCTGKPPAAAAFNLEAVPRSHRTITLRFSSLKALVCKPFAR